MEQKKSIWIKLFYLISIPMLLWTISFNLHIDESFTLGLIKHSWLQIISLDAMDVHPPLYYLVLKAFLNITTFWTQSIFVKVIFSRLFSMLCFIITSKGIQIILYKTLNKKIDLIMIFLGLLLLPNVLYRVTLIRMYSFGSMLITWELVYLINYRQRGKISYLFYALLFAELATYTHYFAAIISGLMLVYVFLSSIKHKKIHMIIQTCIAGVSLILLFTPWIMIAFKQVSSVSHHYWMPNSINNFVDLFYYQAFPIKQFTYIGFFFLIISTIICYYNGNKNFRSIYKWILFIFYGTMFIGISLSLSIRPIFQARYLFFIFPIYLSLTAYELIHLIKTNKKFFKLFGIIILIFLSLGMVRNSIKGIHYFKTDYTIYQFTQCQKRKSSTKLLFSFVNDAFLTIQYSIYLPNKEIVIPYKFKEKQLEAIQTGNSKNDEKLFNIIYPNIYFENKYENIN